MHILSVPCKVSGNICTQKHRYLVIRVPRMSSDIEYLVVTRVGYVWKCPCSLLTPNASHNNSITSSIYQC